MSHDQGGLTDYNEGYGPGPDDTVGPYGGRQVPDLDDTAQDARGGGGHGFNMGATQGTAMFTKGGTPKTINGTTGRSPDRCTDCICLGFFFAYMLFMLLIVFFAWENGSDLQRLTRGADFEGRLCGVDAGVEDKPFLFFCRNSASEAMGSPVSSGVDLERPSCVQSCPRLSGSQQIRCLQKQLTSQTEIPFGGLAGIDFLNRINVSESIIETAPYDTIPLRGKYCVPENSLLKEGVLHGPKMGGTARILNSLGSLRRPWIWIFLVVLVCCLAGYIYLFMLRLAAKPVVILSIFVASVAFILCGIIFFGGCLAHPVIQQLFEDRLGVGMDWYAFYSNPTFAVNNRSDAAFWSFVMGLLLVCIGSWLGCKMCHLGRQFDDGIDLIATASECMHTIGWLMIQPLLMALLQFFVVLFLTYGFMDLVTQGFLVRDRVYIDGNRYEGLSAEYKFDNWAIFWNVFFYMIGAFWVVEITISVSQFMISFCIIAWYFMPKDGHVKKPPPTKKLLKEMFSSLFRHFGSICLGAFCMTYARAWRFTIGYFYNFDQEQYVWETESGYDGSDLMCGGGCHCGVWWCISGTARVPNPTATGPRSQPKDGCLQCSCRNCFGETNKGLKVRKEAENEYLKLLGAPQVDWQRKTGCVSTICSSCTACCCEEDPFCEWISGSKPESYFVMPFKWADLNHCNKDVYNDVVIRATDFFPANVRTRQIFASVPPCKEIKGAGQMITVIGVSFIPLVGLAAFAGFMQMDVVQDETSNWYVPDPLMASMFTLLLCMLIAYSFCVVFDHTADTLLYCYAWHKRNDKGSIDKFIPEKLRYIVGWDDLHSDKYPYYGKASNQMYLSTFVDFKAKGKAKAKGSGEAPLDPTTSIFFRDEDETTGLLG